MAIMTTDQSIDLSAKHAEDESEWEYEVDQDARQVRRIRSLQNKPCIMNGYNASIHVFN